jgi:hypothetical protein
MNLYTLLFFIIIGYVIYNFNRLLFYIVLISFIIFLKNNPLILAIILNI